MNNPKNNDVNSTVYDLGISFMEKLINNKKIHQNPNHIILELI